MAENPLQQPLAVLLQIHSALGAFSRLVAVGTVHFDHAPSFLLKYMAADDNLLSGIGA